MKNGRMSFWDTLKALQSQHHDAGAMARQLSIASMRETVGRLHRLAASELVSRRGAAHMDTIHCSWQSPRNHRPCAVTCAEETSDIIKCSEEPWSEIKTHQSVHGHTNSRLCRKNCPATCISADLIAGGWSLARTADKMFSIPLSSSVTLRSCCGLDGQHLQTIIHQKRKVRKKTAATSLGATHN